jgi:hypothetical protein
LRLVWLKAVVLPLLYIDVVSCLSLLCCRYNVVVESRSLSLVLCRHVSLHLLA